MKELLTRSFFGLLYVLAVFFALQNYQSKFVLLGFFLVMGLYEFSRLVNVSFKIILLPALFIFFTVYLKWHDEPIDEKLIKISMSFAFLTLFMPFVYFIFDKISKEALGYFYLSIFYLAIPFSIALSTDSTILLATFFIIWASDSFAYLAGKNLGKHKLAEKISPKKTIEGLIGGMLGSIIVAFILYQYTDFHVSSLFNFIILALIIVIFGTLGDLLESKLKRQAGVKDSGKMIPGHGGILDRLDSFILAIPFVFIYLNLI